MQHLFPFTEYWFLYVGFTGFISLVLFSSLRTFHQRSHEVSIREATVSALSWLGLAILFNIALYVYTFWKLNHHPDPLGTFGGTAEELAHRTALEFLSGYLVEKALAVDNLFVFIVIFRFFSIPPVLQPRILFYGLFGAIALRAVFIAMGSVVMSIHYVVMAFGVFLIYQGLSTMCGKDPELDPEHNWILRLLNRFLPVTKTLDGDRFFTRVEGRRFVTPLFVTLVFVEITDIMFAFDSVPAIFGLTREPLVVFTSNIFAVIDLRALYFLLTAFIDRFHYLNVGLSLVLIFIGTKMLALDYYFGGKFPTDVSLMIVLTLIVGSVVLSLVKPPKEINS
jgi:tellurite resistance protein TerC